MFIFEVHSLIMLRKIFTQFRIAVFFLKTLTKLAKNCVKNYGVARKWEILN